MPQTPGVPDHAAPEGWTSWIETESVTGERPQPVLAAAKLGGLVQAAVTTVGGVIFLILAGITQENLGAFGIAVGLAVTAVVALTVYVVAWSQGRKAAARVTPLSSPRDGRGVRLVPVDRLHR